MVNVRVRLLAHLLTDLLSWNCSQSIMYHVDRLRDLCDGCKNIFIIIYHFDVRLRSIREPLDIVCCAFNSSLRRKKNYYTSCAASRACNAIK